MPTSARAGARACRRPGQAAVESVAGPLRRAVRPDPVDELFGRDRAVGVEEQRGEYEPLAGVAEAAERAAVQVRVHAAQQTEADRHPAPLTLRHPVRGHVCLRIHDLRKILARPVPHSRVRAAPKRRVSRHDQVHAA